MYGSPRWSPKARSLPSQLAERSFSNDKINRNGNGSRKMGNAVHIFRKAFDAVTRLWEYPFLGGSNRKGGSTIQHGKP